MQKTFFLNQKNFFKIFTNLTIAKRNYAKMLADPENRGSRQNHVNFDILGIWDNKMDFSILFQQSVEQGIPIPKITCGSSGLASLSGRRTVNEDRIK